MDLESAVDELYAGSPEDFIERRKALVAQARAAKDRPLATAVGKPATTDPVGLAGQPVRPRGARRARRRCSIWARPCRPPSGSCPGRSCAGCRPSAARPWPRRPAGRSCSATNTATTRPRPPGWKWPRPCRRPWPTRTWPTQVRAGTVTQAQAYGGFGRLRPAPRRPTRRAGYRSRCRGGHRESDDTETEEDDAEAEKLPRRGREPAPDGRSGAGCGRRRRRGGHRAGGRAGGPGGGPAGRARRGRAGGGRGAPAARAARKTVAELEEDVRAAREAYEAI